MTSPPGPHAAVVLLAAATGLTTVMAGSAARAEFKVRYPIVDYREFEIEHNGSTTFDTPKSGKSNNQSYTIEYGFGPLPHWFVELENELEAPSGENIRYEATTIENYFQMTPTGKYFGDLALFGEYSQPSSRAGTKSFTFGPLAQTEFGEIAGIGGLHTVNLLFTREVGNNQTNTTPLFIAWQSRLLVNPLLQPGFEYYGLVDDVTSPGKLADQQHRIGPVLVGVHSFAPYGKIKYEVGYLFGLTNATERGAVRWRFEFEFPF